MKKAITVLMLMTALSGYCGKVQIEFLDITADRSVTVTGSQSNDIAEAKSHVAETDNPHGVTAEQIGALTSETDPVALGALAAYAAYWPRDATASSWFTITTNVNEITITGYDIGGGTDVVIPDYINGLPVTKIGENAFNGIGVTTIKGAGNVVTIEGGAFANCGSLTSVYLPQVHTIGNDVFAYCYALTSVYLPQVHTIGDGAFADCSSLTSVNLPLVHTVGIYAFANCYALTSVYFDNDAPLIGVNIYDGIPANQVTNYVTNAQATGWGDRLGGMPVVRMPLYADAIYQGGELVATIDDIPKVPDVTAQYSAWTTNVTAASGTNIIRSAWGNQPRLELNGDAVIDFDFGASSDGLHRLTLSLWSGSHSVTWLTNNVDFAEAPELSTDAYNTILIRKIGSAKAEGRQL